MLGIAVLALALKIPGLMGGEAGGCTTDQVYRDCEAAETQ